MPPSQAPQTRLACWLRTSTPVVAWQILPDLNSRWRSASFGSCLPCNSLAVCKKLDKSINRIKLSQPSPTSRWATTHLSRLRAAATGRGSQPWPPPNPPLTAIILPSRIIIKMRRNRAKSRRYPLSGPILASSASQTSNRTAKMT